MNNIEFYKFDGAGNDFVLLDIREYDPRLTQDQIAHICHRRFGVGADGLMTLGNADGYDFEMRYYNSDGLIGSMCGNGGRCITAFAHMLCNEQTEEKSYHFIGFDGPHDGEILEWNPNLLRGVVRLAMRDIPKREVRQCLEGWYLDTGSPHYVQRVSDLEHFDVFGEGRRIRNILAEFPQGTNVDFIEDDSENQCLKVRTYERGVEDETWACGTGVTACAIISGARRLVSKGGEFVVTFDNHPDAYRNVKLTGPVACNFKGVLPL